VHIWRRSSGVIWVGAPLSIVIVDTAALRASTSCLTSRLLDAREAISSSFLVIFSVVVIVGIVPWMTIRACAQNWNPADHGARGGVAELH